MLFAVVLYAQEIRIAVAANVSYVMQPLKEAFLIQHPTTKLQVVLGSSGKLTAQIRHGAPYDMFLSANMLYPEVLYKERLTLTKPLVYAQGALALFTTKQYNLGKGLDVLEDANIHKIALANPKTAPYGMAAKEALQNAGLFKKLRAQFVYGESIAQTLLYASRAADIGLVAKSALFSPQMQSYSKGKNWAEVDAKLYTPIYQGMVILSRAKNNTEVQAFYDFMLSKEAQHILQQYGYTIP